METVLVTDVDAVVEIVRLTDDEALELSVDDMLLEAVVVAEEVAELVSEAL